jgi:hypothetical protein
MSTMQLFFAIITVLIVALGAQYAAIKSYMDARFTSIDNQLKFLLEHFVDHETRLSKVEERRRGNA